MRCTPVVCLLLLGFATVAEANHRSTIVLHARMPLGAGSCTAADLPTCESHRRPTTQIAPRAGFRLYIFVHHYTDLAGMQTAFVWPADWIVDPDGEPPSTYGCRGATQMNAHEPTGPGGPRDGTLATVFDCLLSNGFPAAIARVDFTAGAGGCLTQTNPIQGTQRVELLDCENRSTLIDANDPAFGQLRLGRICVGQPGWDACNPGVVSTEVGTWGKLKATYR